MHERRIPEWLRHAPTPGIRGFAVLAGLEAVVRGILISVFPLVMYSALGAAQVVSAVYFAVGIGSLAAGLMVPWLIRFLPRRWMYSIGALLYVVGAALAIEGSPGAAVAALAANSVATVTTFVCFNAYVLDYISRVELGQCETSRLFYSAIGWTFGLIASKKGNFALMVKCFASRFLKGASMNLELTFQSYARKRVSLRSTRVMEIRDLARAGSRLSTEKKAF